MIGKKEGLVLFVIFLIALFPLYQIFFSAAPQNASVDALEAAAASSSLRSIESCIEPGETLSAVFSKHNLSLEELFAMKQASSEVYRLRQIHPGRPYRFEVDELNGINSFTYAISDHEILKIERNENGFTAARHEVPYESRVMTLSGEIEDSLMGALGQAREDTALALAISDILAWDIDFNTDLRKGDRFRVIVEGLYLDGEFKKYGRVLAVEFVNDTRVHKAYRFEQNGRGDYFDSNGNSLRKAFLKAPLSFRRISSSFSRSRRHPILKIRRPHHGVDYAAPTGTPVSATADGRVTFSGRKGQYGKLVILSHRNGMQTYYGHLSRIASGVRIGRQVKQGDWVGNVGTTGLATGPHLHYEMRQNGRPINPARIKMEAGQPVPATFMAAFGEITCAAEREFASGAFHDIAHPESRQTMHALASKKTDLFDLFN